MTFRRLKSLGFFSEVASFLFLLGVHFLCLRYLQRFDFYGEEGPRWLAFGLSPIPVIFCYCLLRVFFGPALASLTVTSLEFILSVAHLSKVSIINEALAWEDISQFTNYSIILRYLTVSHLFLICTLALVLIFAWWREKKEVRNSMGLRFTYLIFAVILYPLVFFSHFSDGDSERARILRHHLWKHKLAYFFPDWKKDVKLFGLPYHLAHTSGKRVPAPPTEVEREEFKKLIAEKLPKIERPKNIIYILCESCWHDKNNFTDIFNPLIERGFKEFRSVSPVYGGATANAAFEVMTGLPSRTHSLNGVIYQEYASSIGKGAHALPRHLASLGYSTVAVHNHNKNFWHRHIINPKFGFERFVGLEDMDYRGPHTSWADDSILYESTLKIMKERSGKPQFLYLTTVYSHGPYNEKDQLGVPEFRRKMTKTIFELAKFVDEALKIDPEAFILVFGDHKPSLTDFFLKNGILPSDAFDTPLKWDLVGDVPVLIRASNQGKVDQLIQTASGLPFFCMSQAVDQQFLQSGVPAFTFSRVNKLCEDYAAKGYQSYRKAYPDWLYALSLFNDPKPTFTLRLHSLLDF